MEDKGHIKGVPFVDTPEAMGDKSHPVTLPMGEAAFLRARCLNLQNQLTCMKRNQSWTFSLVLVSLIIEAVILATRAFT